MSSLKDKAAGRLSPDIQPKVYDLHVTVDPDSEEFSGSVRISVAIGKKIDQITLHAIDLALGEITVAGQALDASAAVLDAKRETVTLALPKSLKPGTSEISFKYTGKLNHQMRGLYQSRAKHGGKDENYLFTQFEATDARRMFPCFDEPGFKAEFDLTVTAPERFTVISNMPAAKKSKTAGLQTVRFTRTPKMSTYLLALAVARLTPKSKTVAGTKITVWTRPEDASQAGFSLGAAEAALKRLNDYFGLPYQLPKMDLVAVPDFAAGAMENWGAIFFRDSAILIDPKLSSTRAQRRVAEVVTHEIVHQWFGNLVTMKWWNDLWLNEAFATWLSYKIVDQWRPRWNTWLEFEQGKHAPLRTDSLRNTRAISAAVSNEAEIESMFDVLTYQKGGAILRMIESFLGEKDFREGIRRYMRKHKYGNTVAADLWKELEAASGQPIAKMAEDWLTQPGYPLVTVASGSQDGRTLEISQRRFDAHGRSSSSAVWTVPLVIKYRLEGEKKNRTFKAILKKSAMKVVLPGKGALAWLYPNEGETGFFRVALDGGLLERLRAVKLAELDAAERMGVLNHLWSQARNGEISIDRFLDTLSDLKDEESRIVIEDMAAYLASLKDLASEKDRPALARLAQGLLGACQRRLGFDAEPSEDDETKLKRAAVFSVLSEIVRSNEINEQTEALLSRYLREPSSLEPTMVTPVLYAGARIGSPERFEVYHDRMKNAATPEQRNQFMGALAQFKQPEMARKLLDMTLSSDIRGQDAWAPIGALLRNQDTQAEAWGWIRKNWLAVREKVGTKGADRIIQSTNALWREDWLAQVKAFFNDPANREPSAARSLDQSLESIELGIQFKKAQAEPLSNWLNRH